MAVQEDHDLADGLLLGPRAGDAPGAHRADAGDLAKPFGLGLDDVEHLVAECPHQLAGVDPADAAYQARAQVLLDALGRRRRRRAAQEVRLELVAVGAVVDPLPGCGEPLPGRDRGGAADDGDQVTLARRSAVVRQASPGACRLRARAGKRRRRCADRRRRTETRSGQALRPSPGRCPPGLSHLGPAAVRGAASGVRTAPGRRVWASPARCVSSSG